MKLKILFLLFLISFFFTCQPQGEQQSIETEELEENTAITLDVLKKNDRIEIGDIQSKTLAHKIHCTGKIEIPPTEIMAVHSKIKGQITYLKYLPGDYVKKGALLATLENPELIEKQRFLLETKAKLNFAKKDFERKKRLRVAEATTEKTFEETQKNYELLNAIYTGLKHELKLLGVNVEALELNARFQSSINLFATKAGYVNKVFVNLGQMVTPEDKFMEIVNHQGLHLALQVLSKDIGNIQKGQMVHFTMANHPETFTAEIVKINPIVDEANASLKVHCHIKHSDKKIFKAGVFVNAVIDQEPRIVEGLPLNAVVKEGEAYYAFKIKDREVLKMPLVNPSIVDEFVIFDGEKTGTWITKGAYYIEP